MLVSRTETVCVLHLFGKWYKHIPQKAPRNIGKTFTTSHRLYNHVRENHQGKFVIQDRTWRILVPGALFDSLVLFVMVFVTLWKFLAFTLELHVIVIMRLPKLRTTWGPDVPYLTKHASGPNSISFCLTVASRPINFATIIIIYIQK